jgi:uncharacterized membrane protein YsdA (DUF1294 family)
MALNVFSQIDFSHLFDNFHLGPGYILAIFLAVMSFVSFVVTTYDKLAAEAGKRRISENALLILAVFGGAVGEYITMKRIRHKTKHPKFMITLPILCLIQIAAVIFLIIKFG